MASLGYFAAQETIISWTSELNSAGGHTHFDLPVMPENGTLNTISFHLRSSDKFNQQLKFFIADTSGNILWESATFLAVVDPGDVSVDASAAALALSAGTRYKIGFVTEAQPSSAGYFSEPGQTWWNDPGTWPTVNNPVANTTASGADQAIWGHITYTGSIIRKSSTFDIETTLGTITTATLNGVNVADHITGQVGTTVSFAGAATDEITTSGEYSLVLGDGVSTEAITAQVNVPPFYSTAPFVTAATTAGHTLLAAIDRPGTIYAVRLASGATAPTSAQVKAGQDSTGAAALEAKTAAVTATTLTDLVFSTGAMSSTYDYYHVAEDGSAVLQASPTLVTASTLQLTRKGSQFTLEETLAGNVVSATLNGNAITVDNHVGTTVTLTDTGSLVTTSGKYDVVLTDDSATPATETIPVYVNVFGVVPSNNPLEKDGGFLASLANVEVRVTAGGTLDGAQLAYSATATTDASGNLRNIDVSSSAAVDTDPVLLHIRTAAGDSIIADETVGLI